MDQTFMKERKIIPLVLSMSLPMVLSMLVNSLYNIVDSYFVAKVSEDAMTALSLVYPVQIVVTAISVGFGVGINAMIAYFLGAGDEKSANNATTLGTLLSAVHGLLLTIVCIAFIPKFLGMFTGSENVIALGLEYAYIAFAFSMIITVGIALEKIYQAVEEYRRVKNIFMTALIMAFAIMLLGLILSWSVPAALIGIFTANPATITIGVHAMHIISLGFIVSAVSVTCCGALEGLGAGMPSLMISLLRYLIIMIPAALLLCRPFLSDGVWIAFPVTEVMTAVIAWAIYHRQTKHMFASSN